MKIPKLPGRGKMTVLAVAVALILVAAPAALAANGGNFILGQQNVATAIAKLVGKVAGPSLLINNTSEDPKATALQLNVKAGKLPMKVNSDKKVPKLNADKLDNLDQSALLRKNGKAVDSDKLDGKDSADFYEAGSKVADSVHADQADNADKLDGKDSNDLAVKTGFASGEGPDPSITFQFLAVPATVTVSAGQAVHVTSNRAFGSTVTGGAANLNLAICLRPQGSTGTPAGFGQGVFGNRVAQNTRVTMRLSAVIPNLTAGSYQVGLCGYTSDGNTNWNSNEYSYTTAMVVTPPSGGASSASSTTSIEKR